MSYLSSPMHINLLSNYCSQNRELGPGVVTCVFNPTLVRQSQARLQKMETCLVYIVRAL